MVMERCSVGAHLAGWAAGAAAGGRLRERGLRSEDGGPLVRTLVRTPPCGGGYYVLTTRRGRTGGFSNLPFKISKTLASTINLL